MKTIFLALLAFAMHIGFISQQGSSPIYILLEHSTEWKELEHGYKNTFDIPQKCTFYSWRKTHGDNTEIWFSWWNNRLEEKQPNQPIIYRTTSNIPEKDIITEQWLNSKSKQELIEYFGSLEKENWPVYLTIKNLSDPKDYFFMLVNFCYDATE